MTAVAVVADRFRWLPGHLEFDVEKRGPHTRRLSKVWSDAAREAAAEARRARGKQLDATVQGFGRLGGGSRYDSEELQRQTMGRTLTRDEQSAVDKYQDFDSKEINDDLRRSKGSSGGIDLLDEAIAASRLHQDTELFRRVDGRAAEFIAGMKVGTTLVDHGYVSTGVSRAVAETGREEKHASTFTMRILAPRGSNALPAPGGEVILPRGTGLHYMGVSGGVRTYFLTESKVEKALYSDSSGLVVKRGPARRLHAPMSRPAAGRLVARAERAARAALRRVGEQAAEQLRHAARVKKLAKGADDQPRDERGRWTNESGFGEPLKSDQKITNLNGDKVPAPRTFYRGDNPGDERRISTGTEFDRHLFAADNVDAARSYGRQITRIDAKPDAKILYEGTRDYVRLVGGLRRGENLLTHSLRATQEARAAGYDAVWFKRQGDVGTAIINRDKFTVLGVVDKFAKAYPRPGEPGYDPDPPASEPPDPVDPESVAAVDYDLGALAGLEGDFADALAAAAEDAAAEVMGQVGLDGEVDIVDQVSERAVEAARERAAELVSDIDETTRNMLRDEVAGALEDNVGLDELVDRIVESAAFGEDRARLIAETEVRDANERGVLEGLRGARDAGNRVLKSWLLGPSPCPVCVENADASPIELDDVFPSGDTEPTAHPNCRCALTGVLEETGEDTGEETTDESDVYEALAKIARRAPLPIVFSLEKYSPDQDRDSRGRFTASLATLFSQGTGIARRDMPQVPNRIKPAFMDELRSSGVGVDHETVPARSLKPTQSTFNPDEIAQVRAAQAEGKIKDNPIVVSSDGRVLDGHHRWAIAAQEDLPIKTVRVGLPIRELLDRARDFNRRYGVAAREGSATKLLVKFDADQPRDDRGRWSSGDHADIRAPMTRDAGGDQSQPVKSIDELYERARAEEPKFKEAVEAAARAAGGVATYTPPEHAEPGTTLKSRVSAERKLRDEYGGDARQLRDVLRATVICDTVAGARQAAKSFIDNNDVLRVKDRFASSAGGYRDVLVNYRTPGGLVAEVQFNGKNMVAVKNGEGHRLYEERRRANVPFAEVATIDAEMEALYSRAFEADGDHRGW